MNITDDAWFGSSAGPLQAFADARLRAVEEGLPLARDANSGVSAMIDPFGRVTATLALGGEGVLVAALPGALPPTLYSKAGLVVPALLAFLTIINGIIISGRGKVKLA